MLLKARLFAEFIQLKFVAGATFLIYSRGFCTNEINKCLMRSTTRTLGCDDFSARRGLSKAK